MMIRLWRGDSQGKMLRSTELSKIKQQFQRYFTHNVKNRSRTILRLWMEHCEYIVAQRFRRGQQMVCLYRRMWEERALKELLLQFRRQVYRCHSNITA